MARSVYLATCLFLKALVLAQPLLALPPDDAHRGSLRGVVDLQETRLRSGLKAGPLVAEVELKPEVDGWAENPAKASDRWRAVTDEQGRFRIADLPPGFFTLTARAGELRPLVLRGVKIEAENENVLAKSLVIVPPIRLAVRVTPAADPWQRPWRLRIAAETPRSGAVVALAEATADDTGLAVLENLEETDARLEVMDADGRIWLEQGVEVYPEHAEIFLAVDLVPVEGRLYFGGESLAGQLSFGTTQGLTDIRMTSGEDGRFHGYLPREGRWEIEILWSEGEESDAQRLREVEIRRRPGKSHAAVEIRIPPTELRGRVLSKGKPAKDVGVTVARERTAAERQPGEPDTVREAVLLTDADGRFRLRGLEPGNLWLAAVRGTETSGKVRLALEPDSWPRELVLELEEMKVLSGLVHFGNQPIGGAQILALAASGNAGGIPEYVEATTDAAGLFELLVPASSARLDLLVAAPSLGVDLLEVLRAEEAWPPLIVALESGRGTLRCQLAPGPPDRDFTTGLVFRRNGATIRWMQMLRVLTFLSQVELAPGEILLHGLAPGSWESCLEEDSTSCKSGDLQANGELKLSSPRAGKKG